MRLPLTQGIEAEALEVLEGTVKLAVGLLGGMLLPLPALVQS